MNQQLSRNTLRRVWWGLFVIGLAISLAMVFRSRFGGDQLHMLARGWALAFDGTWWQVGMRTSAGGWSPGGLTALLVSLPLEVWPDGRAVTLALWMSGVVGFLLLDRVVSRALGTTGRVVFAVFYWLNPWRIHYTSSLWNSNFMLVLGAMQAWCAYLLRTRRRFWATFAMTLIPGLGFQIHSAAVVFAFSAAPLWWRRLIRVNWWGVVAGMTATALMYLPWAMMVADRPELLPGSHHLPLRNLVLVYPMIKGLIYLVRYASLALPGRVYDLDLLPNATGDDPLSLVLSVALVAIGWLSVLVPASAYRRFLQGWRRLVPRTEWSGSDRLWLRGYVLWSLVAMVIGFAASPTSVMFWQGFPVLHAAVLVVVLYVVTLLRSGRPEIGRRLVVGWLVASLVATGLICIASPMFRDPGPRPADIGLEGDFVRSLEADHPMYHDLDLYRREDFVVVGDGGFMPDVFREPLVQSR